MRPRALGCTWLEMDFECELKLTWGVIRISLRNASECRITKACTAAAVSDVEVWRIGEIEALCAKLHLQSLRNRKVLEDGEIDVAELGPE